MRTLLKFLLFTCSLVALSSCVDVVQIKLDQGSKLYVVDAFVTDQRMVQTIRVTTNDSYFSDQQAPPVVNAVVTLKDLTANKQFAFAYAGSGNYVYNPTDADTIARINHQYELDVNIDGQTYTSLTVQKRAARIDSISEEYHDGAGGFGQTRKPFYRCTLWARDKVDNNTDYYWIKTFRNDTLFAGGGDINVCIDGTGAAITSSPADSLNFTPGGTLLGFKEYEKGNTCKVEIHSISGDTYNFLVQAANQVTNGGLFATTPENVKTNMVTPTGAKTKAVGWFNMATVVSKTKLIE
jgi:hypothetical protein